MAIELSLSKNLHGGNRSEISANAKKAKKDKVRVLMVGPHSSVKGGIRTVVDQYMAWQDWGQIEIHYVPTYVEKGNVYKIVFFLINYLRILLICAVNTVNVVHVHMSERGSFYRKALALLLCKKMGIQTILHHHGAEFIEFYENSAPRIQKWIEKVIETADVNLVLSQYQHEQMLKKFPHAVFQVLYNSVETCQKNPYNPKARGILFVGRLGERKGVYDLLQAVQKCDDLLDKRIKLYLCGDGETEKVKNVIAQLHLQKRVAHIGWCTRQELKQMYNATMLFVLPSYHEGLPMALLEAMSYGIPCIGSRVAAIPETIEDQKSGILIQPGDIAGIQAAILRLTQDEQTRVRMGQRGFEIVAEKFGITQGMAELIQLYVHLTGIEPRQNG